MLLLAAACAEEAAVLDARFDDAARAGRAVRGTLGGRRVAVLVDDCRVFDLAAPPDPAGRRRPVLTPPLYPSYTACERQQAWLDSAYVNVTLGRMAFGAGGCCASGGIYRSRDGRRWEVAARDGRWELVPEPDAAADSVPGAVPPDSATPGG